MPRPRPRARSGDRVPTHLTPPSATTAHHGARLRAPALDILTPAGPPAGPGRSLGASEVRVQPSEVR
jgi:hypothetical protein